MNEGSKKISRRHWSLKEKAQQLRKQGLSYNEILKCVQVSKSTISLWCRYVPLTRKQRKILQERRGDQMKGIHAIQKYFWKKQSDAFEDGLKMADSVRDARFIAGLMLYWAEGCKQKKVSIANSDSRIIRFMVAWFKDFFSIEKEQLAVHLHLHSGQDEKKMKEYWSSITGIPSQNFIKSFVKPEGSGYRKNILYNGTVGIRVKCKGSTYLLYTILGCIAGYLKQTINEKVGIETWMKKLPYA